MEKKKMVWIFFFGEGWLFELGLLQERWLLCSCMAELASLVTISGLNGGKKPKELPLLRCFSGS